jgi:WD40 repeat protein
MQITRENALSLVPLQQTTRGWISDIAWSPDGKLIAVSSAGGIAIWRGKLTPGQAFLKGHSGPVKSIDFHRDGTVLASASADTTTKMWDLTAYAPNMEPIAVYDQSQTSVEQVRFLPSNELLAGDLNGILWLISPKHGAQPLIEVNSEINTIDTNLTGNLVAYSGTGRSIGVIETSTRRVITMLDAHDDRVRQVLFHPTRPQLFSAGRDGALLCWDLTNPSAPVWHPLLRRAGDIRAISLSADGKLLAASVGSDIQIFDLEEAKHISTCEGHNRPVVALAFSPLGHLLASGGGDNQVVLWGNTKKSL